MKRVNQVRQIKKVTLTKAEVDALKEFCDDNLTIGMVEVTQESGIGIMWITKVQVKDLPETQMDITDIDNW